ncbi:hypothetical protein FHX74_000520 [Friedmanniella endophytica]|uniref:Uncharacterized protein n=1 Tax=Microlunatus kandeliicorticis TaxID=1759536 RepID=A0A7W3IPL9_9ACTN|nr:hypothetical protein [Microlunatus kandeliicorticis]MBA8792926.1 hypothetical protein [Microlunatus kandeliicorticis]
MTPSAYATQLPRLSKYDPEVLGEGSLDPMGVAAIADRIADLLAPGLRARMSHPRFVTHSAIGAFAGMEHRGTVAVDHATTPDIAFEWITVEALVRRLKDGDLVGLPGSQKARRAMRANERLSLGRYLRGPRVFGFTGVYRPFSLDSGVLETDGSPGRSAEELVLAWEADQDMSGFLAEASGSAGAQLRQEASKYIGASLQAGECNFPQWGWMAQQFARTLTPGGAGRRERAVLSRLINSDRHEARHVIASLLSAEPPPREMPEHKIAGRLLPKSHGRVRDLLTAAIAYERCTALLTNTFRRLLRHGVVQAQGVIRNSPTEQLSFADRASQDLHGLVDEAVTRVGAIDQRLGAEVETALAAFRGGRRTPDFVQELLNRHSAVQAEKGRRMWVEEVRDGFVVRPLYRDQRVPDDDTTWIHPMRLRTITDFLRATG